MVKIAGPSLGKKRITIQLLDDITEQIQRYLAVQLFTSVLVGVLSWGWLWGIWGLFMGPPLLMMVKAVCDRIEDLKNIGELLGA